MVKRILVCLYRSGYYTIRTHRRYPTTARREHFELLDVSPGPNRTSSDNLATPGSPVLKFGDFGPSRFIMQF